MIGTWWQEKRSGLDTESIAWRCQCSEDKQVADVLEHRAAMLCEKRATEFAPLPLCHVRLCAVVGAAKTRANNIMVMSSLLVRVSPCWCQ